LLAAAASQIGLQTHMTQLATLSELGGYRSHSEQSAVHPLRELAASGQGTRGQAPARKGKSKRRTGCLLTRWGVS
jgi:hypothetical protein